MYIGNSAVSNFLTPCGLSRGLEQISLYFFVNNIAVIVARLTVGRLIVYLSKKTCILLGVLLSAGGTALIAVAHNMPLMLLSAVLMGLGLTAATQLLQAQVMLTTPGEHRGVASTVFTFMGDIGTGAGAALWGALSAGAGYTATYLLAGLPPWRGACSMGFTGGRNKYCFLQVVHHRFKIAKGVTQQFKIYPLLNIF